MNKDFIPAHIPDFENPIKDLLARLDSIDSLNQKSAKWMTDMTALVGSLVQQQQEMKRQLEQLSADAAPRP